MSFQRLAAIPCSANCYLAYETLSDGMKKLIEGLHGAHIQEGRSLDDSTPENWKKRSVATEQHSL